MTPEITAILIAIVGSGALGTFLGQLFGRRKILAESEALRMSSADQLISQLSVQFSQALVRIADLERSERDLQDRVHHLEWTLERHGIDIPPMP